MRRRACSAALAVLAVVASTSLLAGVAVAAPPSGRPHGTTAAGSTSAVVPGAADARVVVLRPLRIDLVEGDRVVHSVDRPPGPVGLADVVAAVADPTWASDDDGTVTLRAALEQAPGTTLLVEAPHVDRVRLAWWPGSPGTWLAGSAASLVVRGVHVSSYDTRSGRPVPAAADRPFVRYRNGGSVLVADATFTALGRGTYGETGVSFSRSDVRVARSSFARNEVGLAVLQPGALELRDVRVERSAGSGVVVEAPAGGRVDDLRSEGNGSHGLEVTHGGSALRLTGVDLQRNGGAGAFLEGQERLGFHEVDSAGNAAAGLQVKSGRSVVVRSMTSRGDGQGVLVSGDSERVRVEGLRVHGGRVGLETGSGTTAVVVRHAVVEGQVEAGFHLGGERPVVADARVTDTLTGVQLASSAQRAAARRLTVVRVSTGVAAPGATRGAEVEGVTVRGADVGVSVAATGTVVRGGLLAGTKTGVRVYGDADRVAVVGTRMVDPAVGVLVTSSTRSVVLRDLDVVQSTGIAVASSSPGMRVVGGELRGGLVGLDLHAAGTLVEGMTISEAQEGVRLGRGVDASLREVRVDATLAAVRAGVGSTVRAERSRLWGPVALAGLGELSLRGDNDVPPLPLPWYGVAALVAAAAAAGLELLRRLREREPERVLVVADHVMNRR